MRFALSLFCGVAIVAAELPGDAAARMDKLFADLDKTSSPGCAVGVIREGRLIFSRGYGMANLDHDIALSSRSVFHVASVSKQFTAAAIVLLAQQGKLSIDDPVRKHIPELRDFGTPLTIRHLLHHTSGLRDQWLMLILSGWRLSQDVVKDEDVMDLVARARELNFQPGEKHLYSNTGYTLLAQIVKRVSGKSLREFTTAEIFEPLEMRDTHFRDDYREVAPRMAYGYARLRDRFQFSIPTYDTVGASSLLTTVEDMAKWDANFYSGKVGGAKFNETMLSEFTLNNGRQIPYRFGQTVGEYRGLKLVEHGGADAGYRSGYSRFPEQKFSVITLCNTIVNPVQRSRAIADIFLGGFMKPAAEPPKAEPVAVTDADLASYAGLFRDPEDEEIYRFRVDGGKLILFGHGQDMKMTPVAANAFRADNQPGIFRFVEGSVQVENAGQPAARLERRNEWKPRPEELRAAAGEYYCPEIDTSYRLELKDGKLLLHRKKLRTHTVEPTFEGNYYAPFLGYLRLEQSGGRITGFRLTSERVRNLRFERR